jgi:hypothetical protein
MATTANITTTYAGEDLKKWVSAALLEGNTLANNLITIMPNVKYKAVMHRLDLGGGLVDSACDFTSAGYYTLTERYLEPKKLQLNKIICKNDFNDTWQAIEQGYSAHDVLPKSFADYLVALQIASVAAEVENYIWTGDKSVNGQFDGFCTLLALDADLPAAQEVTGITGIDASTVIDELGKVADAVPQRLYGKADGVIYVSSNVHRAYIRALGGFGSSGLGSSGVDNKGTMWYNGSPLMFDNFKIELVNGLPADTMIFSLKSNFFFGTGLLSDQNDLRLIDTSATLGDDNVRIVLKCTASVNYAISEDVVTYGIVNSAN